MRLLKKKAISEAEMNLFIIDHQTMKGIDNLQLEKELKIHGINFDFP